MRAPLRVLDLFSGIGGFSLGLERAGLRTVAFCERDGAACRVLRKHWPTTPIFEDVQTLTASRLAHHGITPNVICGGFPCQDVSTLGKRRGLDGARSGLWREFARLVREIRPRYVFVENVPGLRSKGLDRVLGDLAARGYDAEWDCLPASALGAPHRRDRIWIVAYPRVQSGVGNLRAEAGRLGEVPEPRISPRWRTQRPARSRALPWREGFADARVSRVDDGLPGWMDRRRQLGNAVVPQVVEILGRAVMADWRRTAAAS